MAFSPLGASIAALLLFSVLLSIISLATSNWFVINQYAPQTTTTTYLGILGKKYVRTSSDFSGESNTLCFDYWKGTCSGSGCPTGAAPACDGTAASLLSKWSFDSMCSGAKGCLSMLVFSLVLQLAAFAGAVGWGWNLPIMAGRAGFVTATSTVAFLFMFFAVCVYGALVLSGVKSESLNAGYLTADSQGGYSFALACVAMACLFLAAVFSAIPVVLSKLARGKGEQEYFVKM